MPLCRENHRCEATNKEGSNAWQIFLYYYLNLDFGQIWSDIVIPRFLKFTVITDFLMIPVPSKKIVGELFGSLRNCRFFSNPQIIHPQFIENWGCSSIINNISIIFSTRIIQTSKFCPKSNLIGVAILVFKEIIMWERWVMRIFLLIFFLPWAIHANEFTAMLSEFLTAIPLLSSSKATTRKKSG